MTVIHGKDGRPGKNGRDGTPGVPGRDGRPGMDGPRGKSAYELAVAKGFAGTMEEWLAGLKGEPGADGISVKGDPGPRGPPGPQGDIGPMPRHEWEGTELRFEAEPGIWGDFVNLRGPQGERGRGGGGGGGGAQGGASNFLSLTDTPATYVGQAFKVASVKVDESGLEFVALAGGGDALVANPLSQFAATSSAQLRGVMSDESGTGALIFAGGALGAATATSINKVALTAPASGATITVADGATLTVSASAKISNGTHSGTNTGDQTTVSGNAGTVTVADAGGDTTTWPLLGTSQTGSLAPATDAGLTYNATTNELTTTTFIGALTGTASGNLVSGGALGTPSSGTLTNCTGLPVAGITASTSTALGVGSIELGHATNTTLSQSAPGVLAVEGVNVLTVAGGTLTGNITLGENTSIALDPAGSADGKYSGMTVTGTGGATIAFGDLVTLDKDDSRWELVDISVAAAATGDARGILAMAVTSSSDGAALTVLLHGIIRADANFPALTIGAPVYATTAGDVTVTQPTTTDHVIRIIGYGLTADEMYFNPGAVWTTHV